MKAAAILLACLTLAGCVTAQQRQEAVRNELSSWIGKTADNLIIARGVPTATATLSDGRRVVEYSYSATTTSGGGSTTVMTSVYKPPTNGGYGSWESVPQQRAIPISTSTTNCKALFIINQAGVIAETNSEGNGCYQVWVKRRD